MIYGSIFLGTGDRESNVVVVVLVLEAVVEVMAMAAQVVMVAL